MTTERILSFAMSEKLSEQALDPVAGGQAADITQNYTYASASVGRDISFDF
jgi:hypothetical protein